MAIEYTKIELTEKDVKEMAAEKYNLDVNSCVINVSYYAGDPREPSCTTIIVTGKRKNN